MEALKIIFLYGSVMLVLIFFIASTAWFSMEHQRKRRGTTGIGGSQVRDHDA